MVETEDWMDGKEECMNGREEKNEWMDGKEELMNGTE